MEALRGGKDIRGRTAPCVNEPGSLPVLLNAPPVRGEKCRLVKWEDLLGSELGNYSVKVHLHFYHPLPSKLEPDCLVISKIGQVGLFSGFRWTLGTFFQLVRMGDHINHLRPGNQIKMVHKL